MANERIKVPDIGSSDPVDVIELMVKEGDTLKRDDSVVVLESAKASVEVPASVAGQVVKWLVKVGDRVKVGDDLLEVTTAGSPVGDSAAGELTQAPVGASRAGENSSLAGQAPTKEGQAPTKDGDDRTSGELTQAPVGVSHAGETVIASAAPQSSAPDVTTHNASVHAGPAVRKLARQLGVDLSQIAQSSGQKQRIVKEDLYAHVAKQLQQPDAGMTPLPEVDFTQFGEVERVATSNLKRTAAKRLQQGWQHIPQVTQHELVDVTELEAFRRAENKHDSSVKLSVLAFVACAVVAALRKFPQFNASLSADGNELILKKYVHLGFAVDSDRGLLVPVLKDADKLGIKAIAQGVAELAEKARSRKLLPADMQGACFTLSSLGGIGGTAFTPLVNHPEVAILGLSRADWQPVWQADKQTFEPRLLLPLSLSYDHRVIDGADAARFVVFLREQLADLRRLLL